MSAGIISTQRRKQRKAMFTCKGNERRVRMSSHLSKDLRSAWGFRAFPVRSGDVVMVTLGKYKGKVGKVTEVNRKTMKVYVEGCTLTKATGGTAFYPIDPSNLEIKELYLDEPRQTALDRKKAIFEKTKEKYSSLKAQ